MGDGSKRENWGASCISDPKYTQEQADRTRIMRGLLDVVDFAGNGITRRHSMNEQYNVAKMVGAGDARVGGSGNTRLGLDVADRPILMGVVSQINERISMIADRQEVTGNAIARIVNPRPASTPNADANKIARDPVSLEDHLYATLHRLDGLVRVAVDQAEALNSAV